MTGAVIVYTAAVVVVLAVGVPVACMLIGGGRGQHKGDAAPRRRRGPAAPVVAPPAAAQSQQAAVVPVADLPHSADWQPRETPAVDDAGPLTPAAVTLAIDRAPEITSVIGWRSTDEVVNSLFTKAMQMQVAALEAGTR